LIYVNNQSDKMHNLELDMALFQRATRITGNTWPSATITRSPGPVREVISTMMAGEESKRMAIS
jgi:hypothetical protein